MERYRVIALIATEVIAVPMLAISWGQFDTRQGLGFLFANLIWQMFCLIPLMDEKHEKEENHDTSQP